MTTALAKVNKATEELAKVTDLKDLAKARRTAKAIAVAVRSTFSPADVKKGLEKALAARDSALEKEALMLFAEYKAGALLRELRSSKAGEVPTYSFSQACEDGEINQNIATEWKRLAERFAKLTLTEDVVRSYLEEYAEAVQNNVDKDGALSFRAFWLFVDQRESGMDKQTAYRRGRKQEWALQLLSNGDEEALEAYVQSAEKRVSIAKLTKLKEAQKHILDGGLIPRN